MWSYRGNERRQSLLSVKVNPGMTEYLIVLLHGINIKHNDCKKKQKLSCGGYQIYANLFFTILCLG